MCSLDSYASNCAASTSGLSAHGCSCFDFDDSSAQDSTEEEPNISCDGKNKHADNNYWDLFIHVIIAAGFSCGPVYVMSICPEEFFPCFPKELVCNLAADCPRGIDEINCTDYGTLPTVN